MKYYERYISYVILYLRLPRVNDFMKYIYSYIS